MENYQHIQSEWEHQNKRLYARSVNMKIFMLVYRNTAEILTANCIMTKRIQKTEIKAGCKL